MARPQHQDSIDINASPEAVFALCSDLVGMGRFSLENEGGRWIKGATGPALGATFKGANRSPRARWSTIARVRECDPPRRFSFRVTYLGMPIATWTYDVEGRDGGSSLTMSWIDERHRLEALVTGFVRPDRTGFTKTSIRHTLEAMKEYLEAQK